MRYPGSTYYVSFNSRRSNRLTIPPPAASKITESYWRKDYEREDRASSPLILVFSLKHKHNFKKNMLTIQKLASVQRSSSSADFYMMCMFARVTVPCAGWWLDVCVRLCSGVFQKGGDLLSSFWKLFSFQIPRISFLMTRILDIMIQ